MAGEIKKVLFSEGVTVAEPTDVDLASGSGEKNYVTNASAKVAITGWYNVGDLDVARTTTAGDLPREFTTAAGIKITADANTQSVADYVYYDFSLDDVDQSKKLKIQWAQKTTGTYTAGQLAVVITTQADRTTALHTPITTAIPAANGVFTTYFDASTTATLSLVIRATTDMTTDGGIVISDVIVGPGIQPQGAVVGEWTSFTPTWTNIGTGTFSTNSAFYRRVGSSMEIKFEAIVSSLGTASGTAALTLPLGLTLSLSGMTSSGAAQAGHSFLSSGSYYSAQYGSSTTVNFVKSTNANAAWADISTSRHSGELFVPIAEWASSGTINLAQNDVEYASNSGTWDSTDTTSFAYGPAGSITGGALSALRTKLVRFKSTIQTTDKLELEFSLGGSGGWFPASNWNDGVGNALINAYDSTGSGSASAGVFLLPVSGSSTDVNVQFFRYVNIPNDDVTAVAWPSTWYWRVKKSSGGQAVGFGTVSETSSGLMPSSHSNLDNAAATRLGLKQYLHGTTYNGGNAPTLSASTSANIIRSICIPYQMQDGTWRMKFTCRLIITSGGALITVTCYIVGVTIKNTANFYQPLYAFVAGAQPYTASAQAGVNNNEFYIYYPSATNPEMHFAGDVELESKPTWAY